MEEKEDIEEALIQQAREGILGMIGIEPFEIGMGRIDAALSIANQLKLVKKELIVTIPFSDLIKFRKEFYDNLDDEKEEKDE